MSLYDKEAIGAGFVFVSKNGSVWHAQQNGVVAFCGQAYAEDWVRKFGPLARHRICERCLLDSRLAQR